MMLSYIRRYKLLYLLVVFCLFGCDNLHLRFDEFISFKDSVWSSGEVSNFLYINKDDKSEGDIFLLVNHNGLTQDISVTFEVISPSRQQWQGEYTLNLEDIKRRYNSESKSEFKIVEDAQFSDLGGYKFKITNTTVEDIENVRLIGLVIK